MSMKFKVRTWLWAVLALVIVLGGGLTYWQVKGNKEATSPKTSPSATKSAVISLSAGITTSPTSGKTSTPSNNSANPTATPTYPPAGWKVVNSTIYSAGSSNVAYSVYTKNEWQSYNTHDTAHGPIFFTSNISCQTDQPLTNYANCWDHLVVSLNDISTNSNLTVRSYTISSQKNGNIWVGVNKSLTTADQNIIFDSFKVTADNRY